MEENEREERQSGREQQPRRVQWHPGFVASVQIELEADQDNLIYESEHLLSKKPLQMDLLIIKKKKELSVQKNIGRRFRKYNVLEYKGPGDYLSINDFYKTYGYTCFYQSDTQKEGEISSKELTITFVCSSYPRKMLNHIEQARKNKVTEVEPGIYYIDGDEFPMQLIVTRQLSKKDNFWLNRLRNDIETVEEIDELSNEYSKHKNSRIYQAAMDVILRANWEKVEEAKKMCDALNELFAKELEEKEIQGKEIGKEIGQKKILILISAMSSAGETEAIPRLSQDEAFLREMCAKYHVE